MKALHVISFILVVIGGLNWGLVGLGGFAGANWNVVHMILGSWPALEWIVYVLVGLGALVLLFTHKKDCRQCSAGAMGSAM
ncbi:MAG: DUF378 domain-containing protein [Patescibacteria group bacterium]|nr:DUF378 domain-containing protein [Patescibacteria group bacterium]MDE2057726.1 DUF378 domain-containing protein [Patescibacteria group bacterium]